MLYLDQKDLYNRYMDKTIWICCNCRAMDMKLSYALAHSERLGHRIVLQTAEAKLEKQVVLSKPSPDQVAQIKSQMEAKLRNHIFDGGAHPEECHCYTCVQRMLDALVEKSDMITREMLGQ